MDIMQTAMKEIETERPHEELNFHEAYQKLEHLISELSGNRPSDRAQFSDLFSEIKELVKHIESYRSGSADELLATFDSDFRDAWLVLSPESLSKPTRSVFAQEYSFFVGGLKTYLSDLRKRSSKLAHS